MSKIRSKIRIIDGSLVITSTVPLKKLEAHARADDPEKFLRITAQEKRVFQMVVEGKCNKEIAAALNITVRTAKFHVSNLLLKFGVNSRYDLVSYQIEARRDDPVR